MQENEYLLIIVPSTFVEGISHKAIRKIIGKNYFVKALLNCRRILLVHHTLKATH